MALGAASSSSPPVRADADPSTPLGPTLEGAYALGRGEARSGRSMDALLAAYRVGARVAWRELAAPAAQAGVPAGTMAQFAELVFAYIDELSAASVAGHTDELATSGRVRERYRERLSQRLLAGAGADVLAAAAERADWTPPTTLTAVLVPAAQLRGVLASVDARDARRRRGPAGRRRRRGTRSRCCSCPTLDGAGRRHLLRVLAGRQAVRRPGAAVAAGARSYDRAARTAALVAAPRRAGRHRGAPGRAGARRRPGCARRPAGAGARAAGRPAARPPRSGSRRRCGPGCCTTAAATRSPPSCSCTRRPCATGWGSCASCTATGSTTRRRCSSSCSHSAAEHQLAAQVRPETNVDGRTWQSRHHVARQRSPRPWAAALVVIALVTGIQVVATGSAEAAGTATRVVRWVDGDTVETTRGTVRLIGIDTPERGDCGSRAATRHVQVIAPAGSRVSLGNPASVVDRDKYGRILRYVATPAGRDLGLAQIRDGARARYDSRDGYQWHRQEAAYHRADSALTATIAARTGARHPAPA